jgi:ribosomal protein S27E
LQGWASAGGIAGGIAYNADNATPQIHDSYSTGKINCQADLAAAGGIAGVSQGYAYIKDCYTQGDVLAATISGTIYSAGILGKAFRTNPNVVLPDPPTASRVYNCAVFQQNIKGAKDESTSAADYINRITRIDCPDCENPLVVCESSASSGCTCGWTSNDILFVDTSAMQPTYNTTERYCSLMLNDRPIFGKDTMNCHSGTIVLGITAVLLQNSGWDFSNVWYWSAQNKPELMRHD